MKYTCQPEKAGRFYLQSKLRIIKVRSLHLTLIALNLVASLASALAAMIALVRPALLSGSKDLSRGELFYVRMFAARSAPLGLSAGFLPVWFEGPAVACLLFTAAIIQAVDVIIAMQNEDRRMTTGATIGAIVHLVCGFAILQVLRDRELSKRCHNVQVVLLTGR